MRWKRCSAIGRCAGGEVAGTRSSTPPAIPSRVRAEPAGGHQQLPRLPADPPGMKRIEHIIDPGGTRHRHRVGARQQPAGGGIEGQGRPAVGQPLVRPPHPQRDGIAGLARQAQDTGHGVGKCRVAVVSISRQGGSAASAPPWTLPDARRPAPWWANEGRNDDHRKRPKHHGRAGHGREQQKGRDDDAQVAMVHDDRRTAQALGQQPPFEGSPRPPPQDRARHDEKTARKGPPRRSPSRRHRGEEVMVKVEQPQLRALPLAAQRSTTCPPDRHRPPPARQPKLVQGKALSAKHHARPAPWLGQHPLHGHRDGCRIADQRHRLARHHDPRRLPHEQASGQP